MSHSTVVDEVLTGLSDDPVEAVTAVCQIFLTGTQTSPPKWDADTTFAVYSICCELRETAAIDNDLPGLSEWPNTANHKGAAAHARGSVENLHAHLKSILNMRRLQQLRSEVAQHVRVTRRDVFHYSFSVADQERIQKLINDLRELIGASSIYEEHHKQRILRRLEALQGEVHKKLADLDRFWGLIGDAGVAIGKFGKDVKPVVDRIREITEIVWSRQAEVEGLPPPTGLPQLPPPDDNIV